MTELIQHLTLPLSSQETDQLKLGNIVTVSGHIFTGRSRFHIRAIEDDLIPLIDYKKINCFFHVGPVMRKRRSMWEVVSIEPTSSIRFERYSSQVIRKLKLHTIIGKTTMGPATSQALAEVGGVHLSKIGICGNQLAGQVKKVQDVYYLDELGKTEATWILEVVRFGPFFVDMDAHGNNYFENINREIQDRIQHAYYLLGIPDNFTYTQVDAVKV